MKKSLFISAALIGALFTSCKKEDEETPATTNTPTTPTTTYLISMDSTTSSDVSQSTRVRKFSYNSNKKLIKVEYKYLPSSTYTNYDTLVYNSTGQLVTINNYSVGNTTTPNKTYGLNYNGSAQISTVDESGLDYSTSPATTYAKVHTYSYTSGKITGMTSVYTLGANGNSNDTITNITYTGNNISTLIYNNNAITATVDLTAPNPYYGLGLDPTEFIDMANKNNILQAYLTADPTMILVNQTHTYANGRLATSTDTEVDDSVTPPVTTISTTTITYKAY